MEALIAVEAGQPLDAVLEDFGRVPADIYHAIGASHFRKSQLKENLQ